MPIPSHAELRAELHCLAHDGLEVRTAQRWADPQAPADRPRNWLRLVVNGRSAQDVVFVGAPAFRELESFWASRVAAFAPTSLSEDRMWVKLLELAGIARMRCPRGCPGVLPVAWWFCLACGRDVRASGPSFGAVASASKPVIVRGPETLSNPLS